MNRTRLILGFVAGIFLTSRPSNAQYTADFQTNIINGTTSTNWPGDYLVGSNFVADVLNVVGGGGLASDNGYLGYEISGSNNLASVLGSPTVPSGFWICRSSLFVGRNGARNQLIIINTGQVSVGPGLVIGASYIGYNASSSNNDVMVTGSGSIWTNSSAVHVGFTGSGNSLVISNGGQVFSHTLATAAISGLIGANSGSNSNSVLVTDAGSMWKNSVELHIGSSGAGNSLTISNGGKVANSIGRVGFNSSSSNNNVLVTGSVSLWTNSGGVFVGNSGAGNSVVISNGGHVVSRLAGNYSVYIGNNSGSSGNSVLITGSNSLWSSSAGFIVGVAGNNNRMEINGGGRLDDVDGFIGGFNGGNTNAVLVTDAGSLWNNSRELRLDNTANSLVISNGGKVVNTIGTIGLFNNGGSNTVRVTDGGIWQNSILYVGNQSSSNSLFVNGGSVVTTNLTIGLNSTNCDNLVRLDSGSIIVTNATADAVFEVCNGKFILNGGTLQVDRFVMTNACAQFVRTGGTMIYGTAVLDPNRDDDGDGVPNGWEQSHGRDPLNAADVNADYDGDGQSDFAEFQAGTDPTNSASSFRIADVGAIDDDILLTWTTAGGKKYAVQSVAGSYTNDFIEFAPVFIAPGTNESTFSVIHLGGATNAPGRFYRIRLVP